MKPSNTQTNNIAEAEGTRKLLDHLLTQSRLYTRTQDYRDLLDFVAKLRNVAPF
jgi:hypothetical protein